MPSEAIAAIAHDVLGINRATARKAVETQCNGIMRLIDLPVVVFGKTSEFVSAPKITQFTDKLEAVTYQIHGQAESLVGNYGRVATEMIDWIADRTDSGISKVDETLLSRGGPVLDRALLPGAQFMRRVAQQSAAMTDRVAEFVATAGPVVTETVAETKAKPAARKTRKTGPGAHA